MKYTTKVHKKWLILVSDSLDSLLKRGVGSCSGEKKGAETVISSKKRVQGPFFDSKKGAITFLAEEKGGKEFFNH